MARIVYGARGVAWRAPEWIVRNFFTEVVAMLERLNGCSSAAGRLAEMLAGNVAVIDLTSTLDDPQLRAGWLHALDAALLLLDGEPAESWNEPPACAPFFGSVRRFVDVEHARAASDSHALAASVDPADVLVANLPWIFDDGFDE